MAHQIIIGVDEVGVGPLAGPVTACALTGPAIYKQIRDSKKLSPKQREEFFRIFCKDASVEWALASVMPKTIDRVNIFQARRLAMKRAVEKLARKIFIPYTRDRGYNDRYGRCLLLVDGNALIDSEFPQRTIIKGDEKVAIIGMASIIAKVTRDRMMARYHKKYPEYRFDLHKGYGTKLHYEMLKQHGPCPIHRRSFRLA